MSLLHYKGIVWEVSGVRDGKGVLRHGDCTVSWNEGMEAFQFRQGNNTILARELRGDCLKAATDCILEAYAASFVPFWEQTNGTAQEAQG